MRHREATGRQAGDDKGQVVDLLGDVGAALGDGFEAVTVCDLLDVQVVEGLGGGHRQPPASLCAATSCVGSALHTYSMSIGRQARAFSVFSR